MYLAIDIGGTKTFVASIDDNKNIVERFRFPTAKDYTVFKKELANTVANLSTKKFQAAGIGAPGRIDRNKGVALDMGNLPWEDVSLQNDVSKLVDCPAILDNDANLAGLSEAILLKPKYNQVLYVTIGTGIGVAVIFDQKIILPDSEGGHMLLEYDGKLQKWESFASGKAIYKYFGKPAREITDPKAWRHIAHTIAIGMIDLIAFAQPQVIVMGGGVSSYFEHFKEPLLQELEKYETPMVPIPVIRKAQKPEEAVLYGCFELAKSSYGPRTS